MLVWLKADTLLCFRSWKTTSIGSMFLIVSVAQACGYHIDHIQTSPDVLWAIGWGLIFAKDAGLK